jgi:hypothetical protein
MILLRIISSLILVSGLLLAAFGAIVLRSLERDMRLMEAMQKEGLAQGIDTGKFRTIVIRNAVGYIVVGLLAAISGIGLLFRRNWARRRWIGLAVSLVGLLMYQTGRAIWLSGIDWGALLAQTTIIGVIAILAWYVGRRRIAALMRNAASQ